MTESLPLSNNQYPVQSNHTQELVGSVAMISSQSLKEALQDGHEIAILDVRETGVFSREHLLYASSAPLWRLELLLDRLVPRRSTRIVLVDQDGHLSRIGADKLKRLGWTQVYILEEGITGWKAKGFETFSGTNVPSKTLGELVEEVKHTPWIDVDELAQRIKNRDNLVVIDSRSTPEFKKFSLPFAQSAPGAEILLRVGDIAPDPNTLIVVNCAGRTRSIIGAQTLIDAKIPNPVVSLKNGTMEWLISGRELAYERAATLNEPSSEALENARALAQDLLKRSNLQYLSTEQLERFGLESKERTLYLFDIRTHEEYQSGHLENWRWAPGGQLVQATDEFVATRKSRIVLADWDGVRAITTASWLKQLGWQEVYLYQPKQDCELVTGNEVIRLLRSRPAAPTIRPKQAYQKLKNNLAVIFDIDSRQRYEQKHILGAHFVTPDRLISVLPPQESIEIFITSSDGVLASTVAAELSWNTKRSVRSILGGTKQWIADAQPTDSGATSILSGDEDQPISPYDFTDIEARNKGFREYLDWELGLVEQLNRDGSKDLKPLSA